MCGSLLVPMTECPGGISIQEVGRRAQGMSCQVINPTQNPAFPSLQPFCDDKGRRAGFSRLGCLVFTIPAFCIHCSTPIPHCPLRDISSSFHIFDSSLHVWTGEAGNESTLEEPLVEMEKLVVILSSAGDSLVLKTWQNCHRPSNPWPMAVPSPIPLLPHSF